MVCLRIQEVCCTPGKMFQIIWTYDVVTCISLSLSLSLCLCTYVYIYIIHTHTHILLERYTYITYEIRDIQSFRHSFLCIAWLVRCWIASHKVFSCKAWFQGKKQGPQQITHTYLVSVFLIICEDVDFRLSDHGLLQRLQRQQSVRRCSVAMQVDCGWNDSASQKFRSSVSFFLSWKKLACTKSIQVRTKKWERQCQ